MYTKSSLTNDLQNMGLKSTDTIMIHSSMKAIGPVEGGVDTVVDTFMEYFADGLLMMPTHTWAQMSAEYSLFDPAVEPACVGIIPNVFRQREGVVRSLHPTHSIAAYGPRAAIYIEGEDEVTTPCQPGGCWSRLLDEEAKIMMLGCTHIRNTFIHAVEELLDVPERLTEKPVDFLIKMPDGSIKEVAVHRHYNRLQPHISEEYDKLLDAFYECGAAWQVKFGDADCILCDAKKLYEVTKKVLSHEINCLIDRKEIPREWWMENPLAAVHHIAIIVSDYEKSKKFYVEQLGFQILRENYREERDDYKLDLRMGDIELEVFGVKNSPKRVSNPEACGLRHLAFKVDNIEEAVKWLHEKGIETEPIRLDDYTQKRFTFFKDPDNLPLELHE